MYNTYSPICLNVYYCTMSFIVLYTQLTVLSVTNLTGGGENK